jgi:GGDEF domain-containing protein
VLHDHLAQLHEDAVEGGHPISIALFGVDDWAKIEERFEPAARGVIIARVGQVMRDGLRQTDLLFGNREHEFALVLPGTTADSLYGLGERMLRRVEEEPIDTEQGTCLITVSVGLLTGLDPRLHPGPEEFLAEAEALLDHGMHGGPSRIIA